MDHGAPNPLTGGLFMPTCLSDVFNQGIGFGKYVGGVNRRNLLRANKFLHAQSLWFCKEDKNVYLTDYYSNRLDIDVVGRELQRYEIARLHIGFTEQEEVWRQWNEAHPLPSGATREIVPYIPSPNMHSGRHREDFDKYVGAIYKRFVVTGSNLDTPDPTVHEVISTPHPRIMFQYAKTWDTAVYLLGKAYTDKHHGKAHRYIQRCLEIYCKSHPDSVFKFLLYVWGTTAALPSLDAYTPPTNTSPFADAIRTSPYPLLIMSCYQLIFKLSPQRLSPPPIQRPLTAAELQALAAAFARGLHCRESFAEIYEIKHLPTLDKLSLCEAVQVTINKEYDLATRSKTWLGYPNYILRTMLHKGDIPEENDPRVIQRLSELFSVTHDTEVAQHLWNMAMFYIIQRKRGVTDAQHMLYVDRQYFEKVFSDDERDRQLCCYFRTPTPVMTWQASMSVRRDRRFKPVPDEWFEKILESNVLFIHNCAPGVVKTFTTPCMLRFIAIVKAYRPSASVQAINTVLGKIIPALQEQLAAIQSASEEHVSNPHAENIVRSIADAQRIIQAI
jgi:hypothetical protein